MTSLRVCWTACVVAAPGLSACGGLIELDGAGASTGAANDSTSPPEEVREAWWCADCEEPTIWRTSIATSGRGGPGWSAKPRLSKDGRLVTFSSEVGSLVPEDTNGALDIFRHDLVTRETIRVSVGSDGQEGDSGTTWEGAISADGRYVAFQSDATNLVPGDENGVTDVFLRDIVQATTRLVSVSTGGEPADGASTRSSISADGRMIAFTSEATNLVPNDTNGLADVFVHDLHLRVTTRVSISSTGAEANGDSSVGDISADGRYVAFNSKGSNLADDDSNGVQDAFVHDLVTGETLLVSRDAQGTPGNADSWANSLSADGGRVAIGSEASNLVAGDTNDWIDAFVVSPRGTQGPVRVSVAADGTEGDLPTSGLGLSDDGQRVVFATFANLTPQQADRGVGYLGTLVRDLASGRLTYVAGGQRFHADDPTISGDGRYVAFASDDDTLVEGDTNDDYDVFVVGPSFE